MSEHIEFIHSQHFAANYLRRYPSGALASYIDYFWETSFEKLFAYHPQGFTDILFPNLGYTYLINLGTPFQIKLGQQVSSIKHSAFLPRNKSLAAAHTQGNKIFGIKFLVSPILFEKKVNFHEYKESIFSLSYLVSPTLIDCIKKVDSFEERVSMVSDYYRPIIEKHAGTLQKVDTVTRVLQAYNPGQEITLDEIALQHRLTTRTLLRYFNVAVGGAPKAAFKILRIRQAIQEQAQSPQSFAPAQFGFYDLSHYQRHLKAFLRSGETSYYHAFLESVKSKAL